MLRRLWVFRYVVLLFAIALAAPQTVGALTGAAASSVYADQPSVVTTVASPGAIGLDRVEFAENRSSGGNPENSGNRFSFGKRGIWAFISYRDATLGSSFKYIFRFGSVDVNFGELQSPDRNGRVSVFLERQDRDYLMIGVFDLVVTGADGGEFGRASFEIVDDGGSNDNGGDNRNGNDNSSSNSNDNSGDNDNSNDNDNDNDDNANANANDNNGNSNNNNSNNNDND